MNNNFREFTKGLIRENPTLVMLLGTCPTLAITTAAINGVGMGLATTFVLLCSNLIICLLRKIIPSQVRLPCYIVIIASFTTFVTFMLKAYIPSLYTALGDYLKLITVNCIILGRAESFASKNKPLATVCDSLGMGIGFTFAITLIGMIREILGNGSIFGINIFGSIIPTMTIMILPAGGFFIFGCVIAFVNRLAKRLPPEEMGCSSCPNKSSCQSKEACCK